MQVWIGRNGDYHEIREMESSHIINCINFLNQRAHLGTCKMLEELEKAIPKVPANTFERNRLNILLPQFRKFMMRSQDWVDIFKKELKRRKETILITEHNIYMLKEKPAKKSSRRK
jgi:hypothetical protein